MVIIRVIMPRALVILFLAAGLSAQSERIVAHLDGRPLEHPAVQGQVAYVHDETRYVEGTGALRVGPSEAEDYFGVTLFRVEGRQPRTLRFSVFQEGDRPVTYFVKIEDAASGRDNDNAGHLERECSPGKWTEIEIDLTAVRTRSGGRTLDFAKGIPYFRWSRRKGGADDPAFVIDRVRVAGEAPASPADPSGEGDARARALRESLPYAPEPEVVKTSLAGLEKETHERVRRACREALAGVGQDEPVAAVLAALAKTRGETRLEVLWALASMPSRRARAEALRLAADPKTPWSERTALLQGLALRDADDVLGALPACSAEKPWPPRAALVRALAESATPRAVDALIEILEKPQGPRIETDAAEALGRLSGKDLGSNAKAWREWWAANRGRPGALGRDRKASEGYARSFFGAPVAAGRMVFVLDISGSMRDPVKGGPAAKHVAASKHLQGIPIASRLDLARAEAAHAVSGLPGGSAAGVVVFNDDALWISKGIEKADAPMKERIAGRLGSLQASRKTNIHDALREAFRPDRKTTGGHEWDEGPDTIYLLSDGEPSAGPIRDWQELRDAVLRWNLGRMIKIHVITLGDEGDPSTTGFAAWSRSSGGFFQNLASEKKKSDQGGRSP